MKKDIINLVNFLFENSQDYVVRDVGLVIDKNSIKTVISSEYGIPEFVKVSIKEGSISNKDLITEIIEIEKMKNIICDFWDKIEKQTNRNLIEDIGFKDYSKLYEAFMGAISGEKENDKYYFETEFNSNVFCVDIKDKKTDVTSCLSLNYNTPTIEEMKIHDAVFISGCAAIKENNGFRTVQISIVIPVIELEKYPLLKLSVKRPYEKDNALTYIENNLKNDLGKQFLKVFELHADLSNNEDEEKKSKKIKI